VLITVVVPTYNEAENLTRLAAVLFSLSLDDLRLLVVDDHSPDGTGELADQLAQEHAPKIFVIHRTGKLGLGTAYLAGFRQALKDGADLVCQMDADFSHPPEKIPELVKAIARSDVALGSRYVPGGNLDVKWPLWRKGLSTFGNWYARTILGLSVQDVTGGFRLWKRATLEGMPLDRIRSNGYMFQVEMTYVASKLGYQFVEVPIYFADRKFGTSKMSFSIQVEAAFRTWQLRGMYRDLGKN
jgi:dolichol-phosphate mannosyltransferase